LARVGRQVPDSREWNKRGRSVARINGEELGRWSLRLDAAYCAVLGVAVTLSAPHLTHVVTLPAPVFVVAGGVVVVWAGAVLWLLSRVPLRWALRLVMAVNVLAAAVVAVASATAATLLVVLAILAIAIDIALFATSQAVALRALPARARG
jgi:hypothetical protein